MTTFTDTKYRHALPDWGSSKPMSGPGGSESITADGGDGGDRFAGSAASESMTRPHADGVPTPVVASDWWSDTFPDWNGVVTNNNDPKGMAVADGVDGTGGIHRLAGTVGDDSYAVQDTFFIDISNVENLTLTGETILPELLSAGVAAGDTRPLVHNTEGDEPTLEFSSLVDTGTAIRVDPTAVGFIPGVESPIAPEGLIGNAGDNQLDSKADARAIFLPEIGDDVIVGSSVEPTVPQKEPTGSARATQPDAGVHVRAATINLTGNDSHSMLPDTSEYGNDRGDSFVESPALQVARTDIISPAGSDTFIEVEPIVLETGRYREQLWGQLKADSNEVAVEGFSRPGGDGGLSLEPTGFESVTRPYADGVVLLHGDLSSVGRLTDNTGDNQRDGKPGASFFGGLGNDTLDTGASYVDGSLKVPAEVARSSAFSLTIDGYEIGQFSAEPPEFAQGESTGDARAARPDGDVGANIFMPPATRDFLSALDAAGKDLYTGNDVDIADGAGKTFADTSDADIASVLQTSDESVLSAVAALFNTDDAVGHIDDVHRADAGGDAIALLHGDFSTYVTNGISGTVSYRDDDAGFADISDGTSNTLGRIDGSADGSVVENVNVKYTMFAVDGALPLPDGDGSGNNLAGITGTATSNGAGSVAFRFEMGGLPTLLELPPSNDGLKWEVSEFDASYRFGGDVANTGLLETMADDSTNLLVAKGDDLSTSAAAPGIGDLVSLDLLETMAEDEPGLFHAKVDDLLPRGDALDLNDLFTGVGAHDIGDLLTDFAAADEPNDVHPTRTPDAGGQASGTVSLDLGALDVGTALGGLLNNGGLVLD